jgi:hypothetical protein
MSSVTCERHLLILQSALRLTCHCHLGLADGVSEGTQYSLSYLDSVVVLSVTHWSKHNYPDAFNLIDASLPTQLFEDICYPAVDAVGLGRTMSRRQGMRSRTLAVQLLIVVLRLLHGLGKCLSRLAQFCRPSQSSGPSRGKSPPLPKRIGFVFAETDPGSISLQCVSNIAIW